MKSFIFNISLDIPSGKVDEGRLEIEIRDDPGIKKALDEISVTDGNLEVSFKEDLDAADETALHGDTTGPAGGVIGAHSGEPLEDPTTANGVPLIHLDSRHERDGKLLVTQTPSPGPGWKTYYTSAGDDPTLGRGKGEVLRVILAGEDSGSKDLSFNEPTWIHDGELSWYPVGNFDHGDSFSVSIIIGANVPVVNPGGTGNCNLVEIIPSSGQHAIIPAAGDGTHDIDLATLIPAPSTNKQGFFDVDMETGDVSFSSSPGSADFSAYDFAVQTFFVPKWLMGNPLGVFEVDAYQAEWVSERWKIRIEVDKQSPAAGEVGGGIMVYRKHTTTL